MKEQSSLPLLLAGSVLALCIVGCPDPMPEEDAGPISAKDAGTKEDAGIRFDFDASSPDDGGLPPDAGQDGGPLAPDDGGPRDGGVEDAGAICEGLCGVELNGCTCSPADPCGLADNGICEAIGCSSYMPHTFDDSADCMDAFDGGPSTLADLLLDVPGLPALPHGLVYEVFFVTPAGWVSSRRFANPFSPPANVKFFPDVEVPPGATAVVITIEQEPDDDPAPSATRLFAGVLSGDEASLTPANALALGTDFAGAAASFTLRVPTDDGAAPHTQGIWFDTDVSLPSPPSGWTYEGFVLIDEVLTSTGRFSSAAEADSDGAGPAAGPNPAPEVPGQDFLSPAKDLVGATVLLALEPEPGPASLSLGLVLLEATATDSASAQVMDAAAALPAGTLSIER